MVLNLEEHIQALIWWPGLHQIAQAIPDEGLDGRPRKYPKAVMLLFGALSRFYRSSAAVEAALDSPAAWDIVCREWDRHQDATVPDPSDRLPLPDKGVRWHHWKYMRDEYLVDDEILGHLLELFTDAAITLALELGYFDPTKGSLSHPAATRSIFGDGTEVRSAYRCLAKELPDPLAEPGSGKTCLAAVEPGRSEHVRAWIRTEAESGRQYAVDALTGQVMARIPLDMQALGSNKYGEYQANQNIVTFHTREDDAPHSRVTLLIGMDDSPNTEAATAMGLIERIASSRIGGLIQAVVYDKALRGIHLDRLLTEFGYIPVVKVAAAGTTSEEREQREANGGPGKFKQLPLGPYSHDVDGRDCKHLLHVVNGMVVEMDFDERGQLVQLPQLPTRQQVKRSARLRGGRRWHWNVGYRIDCPNGGFVAWVTPHASLGDDSTKVAENLRIFPEADRSVDPEFCRLHGRRNDSENSHSQYKETLRHKRAHTLGRNGMMLDALLFFALENAKTWYHQVGHQVIEVGRAS